MEENPLHANIRACILHFKNNLAQLLKNLLEFSPRRKRFLALIICILLTLIIATLAILIGLELGPDLAITINFFSIIEVLAIAELLIVALFTYYRIYRLHQTNPLIAFPFGSLTTLSAFLSILFASVPHLHVASLLLLVGSFCLFNLVTLVYVNSPAISLKILVKEWLFEFNLPTFFAFLILYMGLVIILYTKSEGNLLYLHTEIEAFISGAAAFHIALSGIFFAIGNWTFLWREDYERTS